MHDDVWCVSTCRGCIRHCLRRLHEQSHGHDASGQNDVTVGHWRSLSALRIIWDYDDAAEGWSFLEFNGSLMSTLLRLGFLAYYQSTVSSIDFASRSGNLRLGCLRGVLDVPESLCFGIIIFTLFSLNLILPE